MHQHSMADHAHAFAWLLLIPSYALLFGIGFEIARMNPGQRADDHKARA